MAYSQDDIDTLKRAIATGSRKVRYESGGEVREVTYRTLSEMTAVLGMMERELSGRNASRSMLVAHERHR